MARRSRRPWGTSHSRSAPATHGPGRRRHRLQGGPWSTTSSPQTKVRGNREAVPLASARKSARLPARAPRSARRNRSAAEKRGAAQGELGSTVDRAATQSSTSPRRSNPRGGRWAEKVQRGARRRHEGEEGNEVPIGRALAGNRYMPRRAGRAPSAAVAASWSLWAPAST